MTREELRDYVDEQRELDNIPYHVYSALIDGIDTLEQEPCDDAISRNQSNACSILDDECPYPHKHCWECPLNYQYELAKHELDKNVDLPSVTQKSGFYCDTFEIGNPCLYCKHEFEPQESEVRNDKSTIYENARKL